ncbi:MAG: sodium:proton antiporter [Clostridia bacterium]|nr:sodium:proton antiporter [Clostridia bacterium]
MDFIQNFPFFSIVLSLFCSVVAFGFKGKKARFTTYFLLGVTALMSFSVIVYNYYTGDGYFVYRMGHYDAPIGNEISAGLLEPFFALLFETVILLSIIGGAKKIFLDTEDSKHKFFYIMVNLVHAALVALCYTNDIFTAYVFIEICTIASCSLLMLRSSGKALAAATRYMIFSLIGSAFTLIGIILLYSITGHLLFPQLYSTLQTLWETGNYTMPLTMSLGLLVCGLAIKSGLFPFHFWMPDTYGTATPAASGILSGVVSKGYIFLLFKIIYRVIGIEIFIDSGIHYLIFILGIFGMIFGSIAAIKAKNINYMIAFSSASQIGYIYMGLGLGSSAAFLASLFQITAHSLTKPMLFLSTSGLSETVNGKQSFSAIASSGHNNKIAGFSFSAGALSMIGIPIFAGFVPKLLFSTASFNHGINTYIVLIALAISTILNVIYFLRTTLNLFGPKKCDCERKNITFLQSKAFSVVVFIMTAINVAVGLHSQPLITLFEKGIEIFSNIH